MVDKKENTVEKKLKKKGQGDSLIEMLNEQLGAVEEPKKAEESTEKKESKEPKESKESKGPKESEESEGPKGPKVPEVPKESKESKEKKQEKEEKINRKYRSKKYLEKTEEIEKSKLYPLTEAVEKAKAASYTKFPATLEIHIGTALKNVRGLITLPYASGKKLRVLAFGKGAKEAGADIVGDDEQIKEISKGKINFDVLVATSEWMPKIVPLAKVLGPKGLMPNPKNGTITENLEKTIAELQGGKVEYKSEKDLKVIHMSVGKVAQPSEEIIANVKQLYTTIGKSRIKKISLAPTMGPAVKVDTATI